MVLLLIKFHCTIRLISNFNCSFYVVIYNSCKMVLTISKGVEFEHVARDMGAKDLN